MKTKLITKSFERLLEKGEHRGFVTYEELGKSLGKRNSSPENVEKANPATPIELLGMNKVAKAGDEFIVVGYIELNNEKDIFISKYNSALNELIWERKLLYQMLTNI